MRQVPLSTVLVASAALGLMGVTPSHAGPDTIHRREHIVAGATFKPYDRPNRKYVADSCVIDLSRFADDTLKSRVRGCGTTISLSSEFSKRSVPNTWGTWSCPPDSEECEPDLLYSDHITGATVDFGTTVTTGGFEYEPTLHKVETVTVKFFNGPYGSGDLVGTITRDVNGNSGALLFGGRTKTGFRSAVVTNKADDSFGIAQIRA